MRLTRRDGLGGDRRGRRRRGLIDGGGRPARPAARRGRPGGRRAAAAAARPVRSARNAAARRWPAGPASTSGTSAAVCTLPAFTVMVFTLTGLIGSPEPGFGARAKRRRGRGGGASARARPARRGALGGDRATGRHHVVADRAQLAASPRPAGAGDVRRRRGNLARLGDLGDGAVARGARDVLLDQAAHARVARARRTRRRAPRRRCGDCRAAPTTPD